MLPLDELTSCRRLAIVGLAKNTGKTEALRAILTALHEHGDVVGVTSVGRDGEARDVLDPSIRKPRIRLPAGSLVATAVPLLARCAPRVTLLATTTHRTPLGAVAVGRLEEDGEVEVAGPGSAAAVAAVDELMLAFGATRIVIDGSLDRRAAANPVISDGVVLSTGAVLHRDAREVVRRTAAAVALLRLPPVSDPELRAIARAGDGHVVIGPDGTRVALARDLVLRSDPIDDPQAFEALRHATHLIIQGALPEPFVERVLAARGPDAAPLVVIVNDGSKVFLDPAVTTRGFDRRIVLQALKPIHLIALTVNPLAPGSHRLDSEKLCAQVADAIPGVAVVDVLARVAHGDR